MCGECNWPEEKSPKKKQIVIDCISDLHGYYPELEGGDLLIVAGGLIAKDEYKEYIEFNAWLLKQKYRKKILVAGNHDNWIRNSPMMKDTFYDCEYLFDSGIEFEGLKIWGSPWTKKFYGMNPKCMAFTVDTDEELAEKWKLIPDDTNILITHNPPFGIKDGNDSEIRFGSKSLLQRQVRTNLFKSLRLHVFGHIHEGYGKYDLREIQKKLGDPEGCVYVNASYVNEYYEPVNKPVRVIL